METRIFDNESEMNEHAATWCAGAVNKAIREKGSATIVLSSETSLVPFLVHFSTRHVDWSRVTCFQLCELSGLDREDPRGFRNVLKNTIYDEVQPRMKAYYDIDPRNLDHNAKILQEADVDLVCTGIGNDGSVGFLQPGTSLEGSTAQPFVRVPIAETLKRQLVDEGRFASLEEMPSEAVTIAMSVLLRARAVSFVVPDINKTDAVSHALLGPVGSHCPASHFRDHRHGVMWLTYHSAISYLDRAKSKPRYGAVRIPGLVDLQVLGYHGVDFTDVSIGEDTLRKCFREILGTGLAVFLPTVITSRMAVYEHNLPLIAKVIQEDEFRYRIPGIHLDGPFVSRERGVSTCHHSDDIIDPDFGVLEKLLQLSMGKIALMTLAAEVPGAVELANYASAQGIAVSLGHQMAGPVEIRHLVRVGAKLLTHFGNGVPLMVNRQRNPIWPALAEDSLMASIITDGHHLTNDVIKAVLRVKGEDNTIVISDMTSVTGLKPGQYTIHGGVRITLEANNAVFLEDEEWFAGSAMTALQCANYLLRQELVDIGVLQKICFYNPLRVLGIDPKIILANVAPMLTVTSSGSLEIIENDDLY